MKMDMIKSMNSLILNKVSSLFSTNSELLLMNKAQKKIKKIKKKWVNLLGLPVLSAALH